MQLLISAIITLVLGTGAFFGLNQHPNSIIGSANGQGKETIKAEVNKKVETNPTLTVFPSPITTTVQTKTNNGLHLGIIRGKHLGEDKEELNENEKAEEHENEHSNPTPTSTTSAVGIHVEEE